MVKREIKQREDLDFLIITFYKKIREEKTLGPIFTAHITDNQWSEHLEKPTNF